MTIGRTHKSGFRCGNERAIDGKPGSTESQVEQMPASGWALRPESGRATEVVKERMGVLKVRLRLKLVLDKAGGIEGTREAGQLVKATRSTR